MSDEEYHGEFRYVNLGPTKIRAMLESEKDPAERDALELAMQYWQMKSPADPNRPTEAGEPYRGEKREAVHAESMLALGKAVKPVKHVFIQGDLKTEGGSVGDMFDIEVLGQ